MIDVGGVESSLVSAEKTRSKWALFGTLVGTLVGAAVVGSLVGAFVGCAVGTSVGCVVGCVSIHRDVENVKKAKRLI